MRIKDYVYGSGSVLPRLPKMPELKPRDKFHRLLEMMVDSYMKRYKTGRDEVMEWLFEYGYGQVRSGVKIKMFQSFIPLCEKIPAKLRKEMDKYVTRRSIDMCMKDLDLFVPDGWEGIEKDQKVLFKKAPATLKRLKKQSAKNLRKKMDRNKAPGVLNTLRKQIAKKAVSNKGCSRRSRS